MGAIQNTINQALATSAVAGKLAEGSIEKYKADQLEKSQLNALLQPREIDGKKRPSVLDQEIIDADFNKQMVDSEVSKTEKKIQNTLDRRLAEGMPQEMAEGEAEQKRMDLEAITSGQNDVLLPDDIRMAAKAYRAVEDRLMAARVAKERAQLRMDQLTTPVERLKNKIAELKEARK